jgi:hypothetical protein
VRSVRPKAADTASPNRPGPFTTAINTHGASPAKGDLTYPSMNFTD